MNIVKLKAAIRQRDEYRCTECGLDNETHRRLYFGGQLQVHRVVPGSEYSLAPGVCVTLCHACHITKPKSPFVRGFRPLRKEPLRKIRVHKHQADLLIKWAHLLGVSVADLLEPMLDEFIAAEAPRAAAAFKAMFARFERQLGVGPD